MKRTVMLFVLAILCAALLAGCGCKHEIWNAANCETPKTCAECGETEGEALGHKWVDADCETAKTCSVCNKTEGEALGHTWVDADCETPKTCSVCNKTEGAALGHTWVDATTEAPKTCTTCQKTEGERIITDPRFTTAACQQLFGTWANTATFTGEMMGMEGFEGTMDVTFLITFSNDGVMSMEVDVHITDEFYALLKVYVMESIYAELEYSGISREDADEYFKVNAGMSIEEYVDESLEMVDFETLYDALTYKYNYYVDGDTIYAGLNWNLLEPMQFTLQDGKLEMEGYAEFIGVEEAIFVRVKDLNGNSISVVA